jgi:UDP-glucose 4-epimerase
VSWLVTGGAGYIGSHVVRALDGAQHDVVVLDDLSTGSRARVPDGVRLVQASVLDGSAVERALREVDAEGVVHIAAKKQVGESVADPLLYWRENVSGLVTLLEACRAAGVQQLVFSSSAAVYGMPDLDAVTEDAPCLPMSPYGATKLAGEWLIRSCAEAFGLRSVVLRYFNVAGAALPELADEGVSNLVPMVFERLQHGRRPRVFGADYPTPDGSCVRDFVHVEDVARAHLLAAEALQGGLATQTFNIGRGEGASVLDVLRVVGDVTGMDTSPDIEQRRPGDPAKVVAAVDRVRDVLGFTADHDLASMVGSAWAGWRLRHA